MAKVRMLIDLPGGPNGALCGQARTCSQVEADELIANGYAEAIVEPQEVKKETRVLKAKETR